MAQHRQVIILQQPYKKEKLRIKYVKTTWIVKSYLYRLVDKNVNAYFSQTEMKNINYQANYFNKPTLCLLVRRTRIVPMCFVRWKYDRYLELL